MKRKASYLRILCKASFMVFFVSFFLTSRSQVTIVADGLNNSSSLFTITGGSFYTGSTGGGDRPANSPLTVEGSHSFGVVDGAATMTSSSINTSNYYNISLNLRLASFSINRTNNGADLTDYVTIEISPDDGLNYYNTLRVTGNNDAYWSYADGTGVASTAYDGDASVVTFTPAGGGNRTTDGYSTMNISNLPSATNLRVRISLLNNSIRERFCIDDFEITGTLLPTFYSKGNLDAQTPFNWNTQRDGSGINAAAVDFTNGSRFVVQNSHTMTVSAPWSISGANSKIQIENGGLLQANSAITVAAATSFQIDNGGNYVHNNNLSAVWAGTEILADNSTVTYSLPVAQDVEGIAYGNLVISGGGTKTMLG
ncbi:MAG: hypothetical protein R6W78_09265, partial [Bacteroidales bacterium]